MFISGVNVLAFCSPFETSDHIDGYTIKINEINYNTFDENAVQYFSKEQHCSNYI